MRAPCQHSLRVPAPAAQAFQAALGVVQHNKKLDILAVHNEGRKLVVFERSMLSNPKIYVIVVDDQGPESTLHLAVGTDVRTRSALLDGKFNERAMTRFVEAVHGALSGTVPAPATPVPNYYMQKKTQVPWTDPNAEPDIELGFSWLGFVRKID